MQLSQPDLDRFWKKVDKTGDCWRWLASKKPGPYGYGQFRLNGITNYAHISSYIIANGSIPKGIQIYHSCKHYWCVNPKHLEALDQLSRLNKVKGWKARENSQKTHCPNGHPLVEGNLDETMLKKRGWRQCLICQKAKYQRTKAAKQRYDKERRLRLKRLVKNLIEIDKESLIIEDDEIKGTKKNLLKELKEYQNVGAPYKLTDTPQKVRIENRRQKKLIAMLEDYKCQLCGWSLECKNSRGKTAHRIDIDHIVEKNVGGTEEYSNLWALCPNCHVKKTVGVIIVDPVNKTITENGKEVKLLSDFHLNWYLI